MLKSGKKLQFFCELSIFYPNYLYTSLFVFDTFNIALVYSVDKKVLFDLKNGVDN